MNIFFESSSCYHIATVLKKNADSISIMPCSDYQGHKVKASKVICEFKETLSQFWDKSESTIQNYNYLDIWQKTQGQLFNSQDFLEKLLSQKPTVYQLAGFILLLSRHPMYFYRKGQGKFQAAEVKILEKVLHIQDQKLQQQTQISQWKNSLLSGKVPVEIQKDISKILFDNVKNLNTYQAFYLAAVELNLSLKELAIRLKLFKDSLDYLLNEFIYKNQLIVMEDKEIYDSINKILVKNDSTIAFSIDSEDTSEIDDAISFSDIDHKTIMIGVHISLPSYAVRRDPALEKIILNNMSTVYLPHIKLTLLPHNWVQFFSLVEGDYKPVISAYFMVDKDSGHIIQKTTRIEKIKIKKNIHLEFITCFSDDLFGEKIQDLLGFECQHTIAWLFQWCQKNQQKRIVESLQHISGDEFLIKVKQEKISIQKRPSNHPIDLIISELMILANTFWADELKKHQVPAIYRVYKHTDKTAYFSDVPMPHHSMNLGCYAWFTSPLRRVVDYVNQVQLLSLLMPQFCEKIAFSQQEIKKIATLFQSKYVQIQQFQKKVEYYWCLKLIQVKQIKYLNAKIHRKGELRALHYPLRFRKLTLPNDIMQGDVVFLEIKKLDLDNLQLDLQLRE